MQAILEAMDGIALLIDKNLIIQSVGHRNWQKFWSENSGPTSEVPVVGQDITNFFSTGEIRETYRRLFHAVLEGKRRQISLEYRCDSASLKLRFLLIPS